MYASFQDLFSMTLLHRGGEETVKRTYRGSSMLGTFYSGDFLTAQPISFKKIKQGDIILYWKLNRDGRKIEVVHRVMKKIQGGLYTRGDNCSRVDEELVTEKNFIGRVTHVEHNHSVRTVNGGGLGLFRSDLLRVRKYARKLLKRVLEKPYNWLRETRFVKRTV